MESGGKTDGYELWKIAASLLGQLPTNEADGIAVLNIMMKLFEEFKQNSINDTKIKSKNETKRKNQPRAMLTVIENAVNEPTKQ